MFVHTLPIPSSPVCIHVHKCDVTLPPVCICMVNLLGGGLYRQVRLTASWALGEFYWGFSS